MSLLQKIFGDRKKVSASVAKNRLSLLIAHERDGSQPDFLPQLQAEILEVISKYVRINLSDINVSIAKQDNCEMLELNVVLPEKSETPQA